MYWQCISVGLYNYKWIINVLFEKPVKSSELVYINEVAEYILIQSFLQSGESKHCIVHKYMYSKGKNYHQ